MISHIFTPEDRLRRRIQLWSWRKANDPASPNAGTVQEAADHFKKDPLFIRDLIGTEGPYFYWIGPDDDFSKQEFEHDGE